MYRIDLIVFGKKLNGIESYRFHRFLVGFEKYLKKIEFF